MVNDGRTDPRGDEDTIVALRTKCIIKLDDKHIIVATPRNWQIYYEQNKTYFVVFGPLINIYKHLEHLLPRRVFFLPCRDDDHYFVDVVRNQGVLIEGKIVSIDEKVYVAGIGGRSPLMNIQSILTKLNELKAQYLVLATCYPPKGLLDQKVMGVPRGLYELRDLVDYLGRLENIDKKIILVGHNCVPGKMNIHRDVEIYCCMAI